MTDMYKQLKDELSVLYPDVTDVELNEMTNNLIAFYTTAVKVVFEDENQDSKEFVVDDKNFFYDLIYFANQFNLLKNQQNISKKVTNGLIFLRTFPNYRDIINIV